MFFGVFHLKVVYFNAFVNVVWFIICGNFHKLFLGNFLGNNVSLLYMDCQSTLFKVGLLHLMRLYFCLGWIFIFVFFNSCFLKKSWFSDHRFMLLMAGLELFICPRTPIFFIRVYSEVWGSPLTEWKRGNKHITHLSHHPQIIQEFLVSLREAFQKNPLNLD